MKKLGVLVVVVVGFLYLLTVGTDKALDAYGKSEEIRIAGERIAFILEVIKVNGTKPTPDYLAAACQFHRGKAMLRERREIDLAESAYVDWLHEEGMWGTIESFEVSETMANENGPGVIVVGNIEGKPFRFLVEKDKPICRLDAS